MASAVSIDMIARQTPRQETSMPPLSRPRRRRLLMMSDSPAGMTAVDSPLKEGIAPAVPRKTGTMRTDFLDDCGIPEGFDVEVTAAGRPEVLALHFDEAFTFIGRDEECGVRLSGTDVSRHHAWLQAVGGQFIVVDLNSRTGLKQNGRPVRTALLSPGDTVEIGPYTLRVLSPAGGEFHEVPSDADLRTSNPPIALAFLNQSRPIEPWTVDTPVTLIGSAKPCRIRLEHSSVSPQHCAILRGYTSWWLVDLKSQAGTVVSDVPVTYRPVSVGDEVQIGRYRVAIRKPRSAEPVVVAPVIEEAAFATTSVVNVVPTTPLSESPATQPQVVNEHLVLELFKEFAALHERTVAQMQQSFREMLEVATSNRPALAAPPAEPAAALSVNSATVPPVEEAADDTPADEDPTLSDLMQSEDPEERAAAQELLAAQMRTLEAKLRGERETIAKRLLRSLSLTK
jgi:pSer/pThr/pTyr-binding forkhead associated (FHA) protein